MAKKMGEREKEMGKPQMLVLLLVLYLTNSREIVILHNIYLYSMYIYIFSDTIDLIF
jgi:hypothetical protein